MGEENANYTFYGENLDPYDEDEIRKKPIPIEDQIVLDKNGKQRFHGAFTGGFAAGYWNTVGSEEGWTPSLFKSSRSKKAQKREQRPQDFMDDEDQEEFGIAPKVLRARQEFGGVSREATRVHGDTLGVAKLLQAATERVGERILRKQGWRHGEGIGPKVSQQEKRKANEAEIAIDQYQVDTFKPTNYEVSTMDQNVAPVNPTNQGTPTSKCIIVEIEGDLFDAPRYFSLAHCIGRDCRMTKGIAFRFKQEFGRTHDILQQGRGPGEVAMLSDGPRYIFYLVTKESTFDMSPQPDMVLKCLEELRKMCVNLNVKYLAMPRICTGLDRMTWDSILYMIQQVFINSDIMIHVYSLPGAKKSFPTFMLKSTGSQLQSPGIGSLTFIQNLSSPLVLQSARIGSPSISQNLRNGSPLPRNGSPITRNGSPISRNGTSNSEEYQRINPIGVQENVGKKIYGCAMGPIPTERPDTEDSTDSESDTGVTYAPEDLPACLVKPKTNTFGMGYSGLSRNTVLSGHINLFEPNVMNAPRPAVAGIRGQAFGVGAFEAEDEDIYGGDDMSRYDFSLESADERKRKRRWDQQTSKKQKVQEDCLEGFKKATKPLATTNYYPPPVLPKDFNPKHKAKTSRFSEATIQPNNQHIRQGLGRHDMTAEQRSVLLGEAKERVAVPTPTEPSVSVMEVSEEFHVEAAVLKAGQLNPFTHDASKQLRYRQFLTLAKEGRKEDLHKLQPKTMTEWERGRELKEFDTASALFKSGPMDDRFVSSATLLGSDEVPKLEAPKVEATVAAAKMKQFGKLTRTREPWQPCSLLCKRFNVPEPNSGTLVATRRKPGFSVFDFLSAAPQNTHAQQAQEAVEQPEEASPPSTSVMAVPAELPVENIPLPEEATVPEDPNARLDFYKAIFLSSSEDEGEEEPPPPPPKEPERLRVRELPREEPPPKPRSPPRGVFANLEQVLGTSDIELPPDSYGPTAPTSLPSAPSATVRPSVQLAPPGSCWVEKESSSHKKKHKHHKKKHSSKEDRHSRSRTKHERSPSSSQSPVHKKNNKSPTSDYGSPTLKKKHDRSVSKSHTGDKSLSRSPTLRNRSVSHSKTSESSSHKKKNDRSPSSRKHGHSKSPTYRRRSVSNSRSPRNSKKKHDRSPSNDRSKSPKSKHHKKKSSRSSSKDKCVENSRSPSLSHKKRRDRSPSHTNKSPTNERKTHSHHKKNKKHHKKGKKECKHHRKDKSPLVISISSSDED